MRHTAHPTTFRLWTVCILPALLLGACSLQQPPVAVDCPRVPLSPAPLWSASAAWDSGGHGLLIVDPRSHSLRLYSTGGELRREIALDPMASFDYSHPLRLQAQAEGGYVLGGPKQLLELDESLAPQRVVEPVGTLAAAGVEDGQIDDFVLTRKGVYAYADLITSPEAPGAEPADAEAGDAEPAWKFGFYRLDLGDPDARQLLNFEPGDVELTAYRDYEIRPYLARLGDRVYLLRLQDAPALYRLDRRKPRRLARLEPADGYSPVALHSFDDRLFVLVRRIDRKEKPAGLEAPEVVSGTDRNAMLSRGLLVTSTETRWALEELDPRSGKVLGRLDLPSRSSRLKVIPGDATWAFIEESTIPNLDEGTGSDLLTVPARALTRSAFTAQSLQCTSDHTLHPAP